MIPEDKVTEFYSIIDKFFKEFGTLLRTHSLENCKTKKRNRKFSIFESEAMPILLLFHFGAFKNSKISPFLRPKAYVKRALIESVNDELNICVR